MAKRSTNVVPLAVVKPVRHDCAMTVELALREVEEVLAARDATGLLLELPPIAVAIASFNLVGRT